MAKRLLGVVGLFALAGCTAAPAAHSPPPAHAAAAHERVNFSTDYHKLGYDLLGSINCDTGPRSQTWTHTYDGTPHAYIIELKNGQGQRTDALRLKIFGPGSDLAATALYEGGVDIGRPVPITDKAVAFDSVLPGVAIGVTESAPPISYEITADCL